jgi:cholest-4-en-3-one 26-monooxygenase
MTFSDSMPATALNDETVRLDDPAFYIDDPFPVYARMRAERPVFWYEPLRLWALTRYDDINTVSRHPEIFSSERGLVINDLKYDQSMVKSLFPPGAEHLMASDPPRHRALRRLIGASFGARGVAALEPRVREIAVGLLDGLPRGDEIEFVTRVAAPFPLIVLCAFMGLTADNVEDLRVWADATTAVGEPRDQKQFEELLGELGRCFQYFGAEIESRSQAPRNDVISSLLTAEIEGERLHPQTLLMFCQFLVAAAGESTRHLLTGAAIALAEHPDQHARLVADPGLAECCGEEFLRWVTPAVGFVRTATMDTELGSQPIAAGDHVLMLYPAGNRDPAVWPDPETFDIGRPVKSPNLAFGLGEHMCLGALLARLEIRIFWEEFARRFRRVEIIGKPRRQRTTLFTAWEECRVALPG